MACRGDDWGATCFWFVIRDEWGQRENTSLAERVMAESMGQASRKNKPTSPFPPSSPVQTSSPRLVFPPRLPALILHRLGRLVSAEEAILRSSAEQRPDIFNRELLDCRATLSGQLARFLRYPTAHPRSAQFLALRFINMNEKRATGIDFSSLLFIFFSFWFYMTGSILTVVGSEGHLIASEIFANYVLTDLGVSWYLFFTIG